MAPKSSAPKSAHKKEAPKSKEPKKGSKLASLKSAIFGAAKRKNSSNLAAQAAAASAQKAAKVSHQPEKADMKEKDSHSKKAKAAVPSTPSPAHQNHQHQKKSAAPSGKPNAKHNPAAAAAAALARARPGGREGSSLNSGRTSFDSVGDAVCREVACEGLGTSGGYCRMHYIKNWKKIKRKEVILKEGKLNQYIEELVAKYPDKYIEAIRQDLTNDKEFAKVIHDLDLDESVDEFSDAEGESLDAIVGDIKRDFDDEGDAF